MVLAVAPCWVSTFRSGLDQLDAALDVQVDAAVELVISPPIVGARAMVS